MNYRRVLYKVWEFLCLDKMPVGLTLLLSILAAVSAAVGTYKLAPKISATIEVQKARAQYIFDNLKLLNSDTADLFAVISAENQTLSSGGSLKESDFLNIRRQITRLQWRANEYEVLFIDDKPKNVIEEYSEALSELGKVSEAAANQADVQLINAKAEKLAESSRQLIKMLSSRTEWSSSFRPAYFQ